MNSQIKIMTALVLLTASAAQGKPATAATKANAYYKKLSEYSYVMKLTPGAKLIESLKAFQKATGVKAASVTGLGVLRNAQLGQYRFPGEALDDGSIVTTNRPPLHVDVVIPGHREIVGLFCDLTTNVISEKGIVTKSDPHCHVALSGSDQPQKDSKGGYPVVGGHLIEGEVAVIAEIFITAFPTALNKESGGELGGTILKLDESEGGIALR